MPVVESRIDTVVVYQQGAPGAWLSFQTVFMNPYVWFMNVWFRRVRLTTVSDLFEDRYASKGLSLFYATFQILVACVFLGFGNVTAYKIASSLVVKQEVQWTAEELKSEEFCYRTRTGRYADRSNGDALKYFAGRIEDIALTETSDWAQAALTPTAPGSRR